MEERSPILSLSIEHLLAMMLDSKSKNKDIFDYWKKRKKDIQAYSGICFDNNELDLYYEIVNEDNNTMLAELKRQGIIDQLNPNAMLISSFHNEYGEEVRPAKEMIKTLDICLLMNIFERGKSMFGINKRYLKNMKEYLQIICYIVKRNATRVIKTLSHFFFYTILQGNVSKSLRTFGTFLFYFEW